jgi:hypothetical protein
MIEQDLLTELQYALLEPPDGGASWPSEIWTRDEVLDNVDAALRYLLRTTQLVITRTELPVLAGALFIAMPANWLATGALVWRALDGTRTPLGPVDAFEGDLALPSWETAPGLPLAYADLDGATLTLKLVPTPLAAGTVELLYVARPPATTGSSEVLPIPDEFASGIKYYALGQLLSNVGRLLDPERAAYCDRRVEITQAAATIILGGWA